MITAGESFYCVNHGRTLFSQTFSPSLPTLHGRKREGGGSQHTHTFRRGGAH